MSLITKLHVNNLFSVNNCDYNYDQQNHECDYYEYNGFCYYGLDHEDYDSPHFMDYLYDGPYDIKDNYLGPEYELAEAWERQHQKETKKVMFPKTK